MSIFDTPMWSPATSTASTSSIFPYNWENEHEIKPKRKIVRKKKVEEEEIKQMPSDLILFDPKDLIL
jgi:hypothetical protein